MSNFRRKYLIEPNFQIKFLNFITLGIVINLFMYVLSNLFLFYRLTSFVNGAHGAYSEETVSLIEDLSRDQLYILLFSSLLITLFSYGVGLVMTHRVAGPLFRINKNLDDYNSTKKFSKIVLREKDFFKETADKINLAMIDKS
ncbi:MAG: hypothetical protein JNL11_06575 [Bdellovibrionaceae bacterium]|nr:hypothetical protein [Pseudobdellovibrionaceae bacterium]